MKSGASNVSQQLDELNRRRHEDQTKLKQSDIQERYRMEQSVRAAEEAEVRQREEKRLRLKEITAEDRKLKELMKN